MTVVCAICSLLSLCPRPSQRLYPGTVQTCVHPCDWNGSGCCHKGWGSVPVGTSGRGGATTTESRRLGQVVRKFAVSRTLGFDSR